MEIIIPVLPPRQSATSQRSRRRTKTATVASREHDALTAVNRPAVVGGAAVTQAFSTALDSQLRKDEAERRRRRPIARATSSKTAKGKKHAIAESGHSSDSLRGAKRALCYADEIDESSNADEG